MDGRQPTYKDLQAGQTKSSSLIRSDLEEVAMTDNDIWILNASSQFRNFSGEPIGSSLKRVISD